MNTDDLKKQIQDILDGLSCILSAHNSCAEIVEIKNNKVTINCIGPCVNCDNRCIESSIKDKLPNVEVEII